MARKLKSRVKAEKKTQRGGDVLCNEKILIAVKPRFKRWAAEFARHRGRTLTSLIVSGLAREARAYGHEPPPL